MRHEQQQSDSTGSDGVVASQVLTGPDAAHAIPHLEFDETVPPRPEEEIADAARAEGPAF